jgi:uncharacterized tellurite resistance protein B-like protein
MGFEGRRTLGKGGAYRPGSVPLWDVDLEADNIGGLTVMSIREWFQSIRTDVPPATGDTDTVRRIVAELDELDPSRARFLAAFAYVLSRVASADLKISDVETARMVEFLVRLGHLSEAQAILVVEIAKNQNKLFGGTENFLVTRELRDIASDAEREDLLDCLFAISAADDAVSGDEETQIWQIARELGFSHDDYIRVRMAYSSKRTVLRRDEAAR